MSLVLVGDVHAWWKELDALFARHPKDDILLLGDCGIGFPQHPYPENFPSRVKLLRGNHDNPEVCRKHPNYLGDYGYLEKQGLFFVSGAYSVDRDNRQEGVDWWRDEELSIVDFDKALTLYKEKKPRIVVSHEAPYELVRDIYSLKLRYRHKGVSRTGQALDAMFEAYQPETWIHAHHHISLVNKFKGTLFISLAELETYKLEDISWEM
jgi:predicted phosphodiesterase